MLSDISRHRRNFIFLFVIVLAACSKYEPIKPPKNIKINPNPEEKYLLSMQVDTEVNDIFDVKVSKLYSVSNIQTCSPIDLTRSLGGSWRSIDRRISSKLQAESHNTYQTIYYPQYYLDEPYYSIEICEWEGQYALYEFMKNNVQYAVVFRESDITKSAKLVFQCALLKENRLKGLSEYCKEKPTNELSMPNSYFELVLISKEYE